MEVWNLNKSRKCKGSWQEKRDIMSQRGRTGIKKHFSLCLAFVRWSVSYYFSLDFITSRRHQQPIRPKYLYRYGSQEAPVAPDKHFTCENQVYKKSLKQKGERTEDLRGFRIMKSCSKEQRKTDMSWFSESQNGCRRVQHQNIYIWKIVKLRRSHDTTRRQRCI